MNLFEFAEKFRLSLPKVKQMHKAGYLRLDDDLGSEATAIRHLLSRGQPLTAAMLCTLVEDPGMALDLGRYSARAQAQLDDLGNAKAQAAPKEVAAYISDAARGDPQAVAVLVNWLKDVIPARPVNHSFIAVRLLLGLAPSVRKFDIPRIPRALLECRKVSDFAGWWLVSQNGTRGKTFYKRPDKKALASFDL